VNGANLRTWRISELALLLHAISRELGACWTLRQRTRSHFREHGKSVRFDANHTTTGLQSCSRSGSLQSGEEEFHLQDAADHQSFGGEYKCSGDTAVTRMAHAMMNTMIFSLPGESHRRRHSISVVLPLIHRTHLLLNRSVTQYRARPSPSRLRKCGYQILQFVDFRHRVVGVQETIAKRTRVGLLIH